VHKTNSETLNCTFDLGCFPFNLEGEDEKIVDNFLIQGQSMCPHAQACYVPQGFPLIWVELMFQIDIFTFQIEENHLSGPNSQQPYGLLGVAPLRTTSMRTK
jgi:hypothetical protein